MFGFRFLLVWFCIFLIAMMTSANILAVELSKPSAEELLSEFLDESIDREDLLRAVDYCPHDSFIMSDGTEVELDSEELDPLTERILELCPDLTTGELMAIETMMAEQLDTPDGEDKFNFYIHYLADSDEPLDVKGRTAHELYTLSTYYQNAHHHFEQIITNYGHMSSDKKVEF